MFTNEVGGFLTLPLGVRIGFLSIHSMRRSKPEIFMHTTHISMFFGFIEDMCEYDAVSRSEGFFCLYPLC